MGEHPTGFPLGDIDQRCNACAWFAAGRCVACTDSPPVAGAPACVHWEAPVSCDPCGACCREAFDSVPVGPDDEHVARAHPELVRVHDDGWRDLQRVATACGTACIALRGDGGEDTPFRCVIYADRPTNCRELDPGSRNCLLARRRVGIAAPPLR